MCGYCGCQSIEMIGRFMAEHEDIANLAGDLRRTAVSGDSAAVSDALDSAMAQLQPHTGAEEKGLFTVLRRNPDFTDHIATLCAEHDRLDELAEQIRRGHVELIDTFVHELREHINKEENGLFPAAAIEMSGEDWDEAETLTRAP